jgi:hypothetical protein
MIIGRIVAQDNNPGVLFPRSGSNCTFNHFVDCTDAPDTAFIAARSSKPHGNDYGHAILEALDAIVVYISA